MSLDDKVSLALAAVLVLTTLVVGLACYAVSLRRRLEGVERAAARLRTDLESWVWLLLVKTAPRDLDTRDLQVVYDVDFLGRRHEEIARETERPVDEVYRRYERGRERLDRWTTPPKA